MQPVKINYDFEGNMKINVASEVRTHVLSTYAKLLGEISLAAVYFNNKDVSCAEKEMYIATYLKMMQNLSFLHNFLLMTGMTNKDITEATINPF